MAKNFTIEQLRNYNGLQGKPAYVGYKGKVYDVSKVFQNGEHAGVKAGTDISGVFGKGPHTEDIFGKYPVVGNLVTEPSFTQKLFQVSSQRADLILRLALGIIFFAHGAQKLLGWFGGYGWTGTMGFLTQTIGLSSPIAGLVILIEFFGGIAIILGLLTRPAALGLFAVIMGAIIKVHMANGFFLDAQGPKDGFEFLYALGFLALYLLVKGSGKLSLDNVISDSLNK